MKRVIAVIVLMSVVTAAFAAGENVVVLYRGRSETNTETLTLLQRYFRPAAICMRTTTSGAAIRPGDFDRVIVLSTGFTSGTDPALAQFVDTYGAPEEIILLSLLARSGWRTSRLAHTPPS